MHDPPHDDDDDASTPAEGWRWMTDPAEAGLGASWAAQSRAVWTGAGFVAGLCLASLCASGAVFGARTHLQRRLGAVERQTGRQVRVGAIDLGLTTGLRLRRVSISAPGTDVPQISVDEVETDLGLLRLLSGTRRPDRVRVRGLRVAARVTADGVEGLEDLTRLREAQSETGGSEGAGAGAPLSVEVDDSDVLVQLALPGQPALHMRAGAITLAGFMGGSQTAALTGSAEITAVGRSTKVDVRLSPESVEVTFRSPLLVPWQEGTTRVLVGLRGLSRDAAGGETSVTGLRVTGSDGALSIGRVVAIDGEDGLAPGVDSMAALVIEDLDAPRLRAQRITVELGPGPWGPFPRAAQRVVVEGGWFDLAEHGLEGRVGVAAIDVAQDALAALSAGRWQGALEGLSLVEPELRLRLAEAHLPLGGWRRAASGVEDPASAAAPGLGIPRLKWLSAALAETSFYLRDGAIDVDDPRGNRILALHGLSADLGGAPGGEVAVSVDTELVRGDDPPGHLAVHAALDAEGVVRRARGQVAGRDVAHLMSRLSEHMTITPDSRVDLDFTYSASDTSVHEHRLTAKARLSDFGFESWRVAHAPLAGVDAQIELQVTLDGLLHRTVLDVPRAQLGEAFVRGKLVLDAPPGKPPRFDVSLEMPLQDCGKLASAIPKALIPRLTNFEARGELDFRASFGVDLAKPRELALTVEGSVDRCEVTHLSDTIDLSALKASFVHHPIEPEKGRRDDITLGPGSSEWVAFHLLPRFVTGAAVVTEDRGYYTHRGVRWELIQRALRLNFEKGRFVYGGSTITQQLVKNLFLTREKTLARKLEELIIAWQIERVLTKDEILALYLNLIEYGPSIYGLKHASRFYFGKLPWELSPLEAAFIMGLKPWPAQGYKQWEKGKINGWWLIRLDKVLDMMHRREKVITAEERALALPAELRFRRPDEPTYGAARYVPPGAPPPPAPE